MSDELFAFDEDNYRDGHNAFRGARQQEFNLGDYTIESSATIDVRAERRVAGPYSIVRVRSKAAMTFRRSWSHISEDTVDLTLLWFIKSGSLAVTHAVGSTVAHAGDFVVTKSSTPVFIECRLGTDSSYETLQVVVPNRALQRFSLNRLATGFRIPANGHDFITAEHILLDLFEDGGEVSDATAQQLIDCTLEVLSQAICRRAPR